MLAYRAGALAIVIGDTEDSDVHLKSVIHKHVRTFAEAEREVETGTERE